MQMKSRNCQRSRSNRALYRERSTFRFLPKRRDPGKLPPPEGDFSRYSFPVFYFLIGRMNSAGEDSA